MSKQISYILITVPNHQVAPDIYSLVKDTPNSQIIDFYTMDMDLLAVIAKHRIFPKPTLLVMSNTKVIGRFVATIPRAEKILKWLNKEP